MRDASIGLSYLDLYVEGITIFFSTLKLYPTQLEAQIPNTNSVFFFKKKND